jgi:class 3 adenylate cyclase
MTQIALAHGATIDKYMGDAMMVFFGDPETRGVKEDARACVEMALSMLERLAELQQRWRNVGFDNPFEIRIGINTGYCNVGNFGSDQRLSYTIIGGEVNLAQRLESNADVGGILMSYETWVHVQDLVEVEPRGAISMKGIARNIKTYAVTGRKQPHHQKSYALSHPAGISIELDPAILDADTKGKLADQLSELADRLRAEH